MEWFIILFFFISAFAVNLFERKLYKRIDDLEDKINRLQNSIDSLN
jgi:hypothetical protein